MVANAGRFILMCFGNLIWPGLGNLFIGNPLGWISSPIRVAKHAIARRMEERSGCSGSHGGKEMTGASRFRTGSLSGHN
jgi:hypothetical protein